MDDIEDAIENSVKNAIKKVRSTTIEESWAESIVRDAWWISHGVKSTLSNVLPAEGGGVTCIYPGSIKRAHEYFLQSPNPQQSEAIANLIYDVPAEDRPEVVRCAVLGALILMLMRGSADG